MFSGVVGTCSDGEVNVSPNKGLCNESIIMLNAQSLPKLNSHFWSVSDALLWYKLSSMVARRKRGGYDQVEHAA